MSILFGAFGGAALITLSAPWGDISGGAPIANANVTLTFAGSSRTLRIEHTLPSLDFEYRVNSGTYTNCPTGTEFSVSSGDTLNFRVASGGGESSTINVFDLTISASGALDAFTVNIP